MHTGGEGLAQRHSRTQVMNILGMCPYVMSCDSELRDRGMRWHDPILLTMPGQVDQPGCQCGAWRCQGKCGCRKKGPLVPSLCKDTSAVRPEPACSVALEVMIRLMCMHMIAQHRPSCRCMVVYMARSARSAPSGNHMRLAERRIPLLNARWVKSTRGLVTVVWSSERSDILRSICEDSETRNNALGIFGM